MHELGTELVKLEVVEHVAEITINRPKALNALNQQVLRELAKIFDHLSQTENIAAVILTGSGDRAFVAGADITEMNKLTVRQAQVFADIGQKLFERIENFPAPVLAAVNGFALGGGCELALACDIIYASENAKFGQPEVKLGLIPGFGGGVRLPRRIGVSAAAEWIFTGEIYGAQAAKEVGLVREVLAPEKLLPRVREVARLISRRAPLAVRAAKRVLVQGMAANPSVATSIEQASFAQLFSTEDMREGTTAFVEKRDAVFAGK